MAVITESHVRSLIKKTEDKVFVLKDKEILTPSAKQYLSDSGVKVVSEKEAKQSSVEAEKPKTAVKAPEDSEKPKPEMPSYQYVCYETGAQFIKKPEHMTQINGNLLVVKNHKRIILRGQIDAMLAAVVKQHQQFLGHNSSSLKSDMKELGHWIRTIQRSEILEEPMPALSFMGYDEATQKAMSHDPMKYFGVRHLFGINEETHEIAVTLNVLRAQARTMELSAVEAFYKPRAVERPDLLMAFNRFSSCIYLMMLRAVTGQYDKA